MDMSKNQWRSTGGQNVSSFLQKKNNQATSELVSSHQCSIKASQPCVIIDSKTIKDRRLETLVNIYQQNINPMWNWNRQGNVKSIDICVAWSKMLGHLFSNIFFAGYEL